MFRQYTHQQPVADMLKRLIEGARNSRHRRRAMNALSVFERAPWQPQAFELALTEEPGEFTFESQFRLEYRPPGTGRQERTDLKSAKPTVPKTAKADAAQAIADVLERYLDLVSPDQTPDEQKFYDSREAAEYLGIPLDTLKHHVHRAKTLPGVMIGNSLAFSQEALETFKANKRPRGRPKQAPGRN